MVHPLPCRSFRQLPLTLAALAVVGAGGRAQAPTEAPFGTAACTAWLDATRDQTLARVAEQGLRLPDDFLAFLAADPVRYASVYGCGKDPLPVLLGLRSLEIDLGTEVVRERYPQLALAFAIQGSYRSPNAKASGWNDGDDAAAATSLPDVRPRPPLQLVIPGDPRVPVDTKAKDRPLDRDDHIINFLEDHEPIEVDVTTSELPPLEYDAQGRAKPRGKAVAVTRKVRRGLVAADVIASRALQQEFTAYLAAKGIAVDLECGDRVVHWQSTEAVGDKQLRQRIAAAHELFHEAYRRKGRMPAERDRAPTPAESMAWFVRNDQQRFPAAVAAERPWPRFPLNAPWPVLLMLAADDQPLREREAIWERYRDHGELRTYGEYIGGIAQQFDMQSARRITPFPFAYGSIQMMWKDGGVCGTMGNIGARTWRIVGVPASTAGQPGHCAIVYFEPDGKGGFRCRGGQYATGGDEVTTVHAGWNYDGRGGRRPMVFHQAVAWGVNADLPAFVETLVMQRVFEALPAERRAAMVMPFVQAALAKSPFALSCIDTALGAAVEAATAVAIAEACAVRFAAVAAGEPHALYRATVRDLAHRRVLDLPAPATPARKAALLQALERQECAVPELLARCWRDVDGEAGFRRRTVAAVERYLASPARTKEKRAPERFAATIQAWAKTTPKRERAAWAGALLAPFAGQEALPGKARDQGQPRLDPVVEALCKLAGRAPPKLGG